MVLEQDSLGLQQKMEQISDYVGSPSMLNTRLSVQHERQLVLLLGDSWKQGTPSFKDTITQQREQGWVGC